MWLFIDDVTRNSPTWLNNFNYFFIACAFAFTFNNLFCIQNKHISV